MSNLLDELFVSIGLDTRAFDKGKAQVEKGFSDTKDAARKSAVDIEASGRQASAFFRTMRNEVAGLFLVLGGASTFKSFVSDIVDGAANTDRLAKNMGVARNELYAWQNLVKGFGGDANEATTALSAMANQIQSYRLGRKTGNEANLAGLGVTAGDMTDPASMLLKIADAANKMPRAEYANRLGMLGFSPQMIDMMSQGRRELEKQVAVMKDHAQYTDEDVEKSRQFQRAWADITTHFRGVLTPVITDLVGKFTEWLKSITTDDWQNFGNTMTGIGKAFLYVANSIQAAWNALDSFDKAIDDFTGWYGLKEQLFGSNAPPSGSGPAAVGTSTGGDAPAGSGGPVSGLFNVLAGAYGNERARGIWAGIGAESGWNPNNVNPTSGAYGLGQWLGPRKKALFKKYGPHPTAAQQIEFLMSELNGGDPGGASVLRSGSAAAALSAYVHNFMRPGAGASGDMRRGMGYLGQRVPVGAAPGGGGGNTTTIGSITVYAPTGNGKDIAGSLERSLKSRGAVFQSSSGMSQ